MSPQMEFLPHMSWGKLKGPQESSTLLCTVSPRVATSSPLEELGRGWEGWECSSVCKALA